MTNKGEGFYHNIRTAYGYNSMNDIKISSEMYEKHVQAMK